MTITNDEWLAALSDSMLPSNPEEGGWKDVDWCANFFSITRKHARDKMRDLAKVGKFEQKHFRVVDAAGKNNRKVYYRPVTV